MSDRSAFVTLPVEFTPREYEIIKAESTELSLNRYIRDRLLGDRVDKREREGKAKQV